jgi:hypothetical protein
MDTAIAFCAPHRVMRRRHSGSDPRFYLGLARSSRIAGKPETTPLCL